jgi:dipeptide transport system permease protein
MTEGYVTEARLRNGAEEGKDPKAYTFKASPSRSLWELALRRFVQNRAAIVGTVMFVTLLLVAVFAPYIAPRDPLEQSIAQSFQPGFWESGLTTEYLLGSDWLGRDLLSRLICGSRVTVAVASVAVGISLVAGVSIGLVSGYYSGALDNILMRVMDIVLAFPTLILAIAVIAILGPSEFNAMIAIGIVYTPAVARVVRGSVLAMKEEDFILATRAVGSSNSRILLRHITPNVIGPTVVYATLTIASAILDTSFLGFLGLGAQPPRPEWGTMLSDSRDYIILGYWWVAMFPGFAIFLAVLGINLMGDGLRDALDPRSGERV